MRFRRNSRKGDQSRKVRRWACADCGWPWPLSNRPSRLAACDYCEGPVRPSERELAEVQARTALDLTEPRIGLAW